MGMNIFADKWYIKILRILLPVDKVNCSFNNETTEFYRLCNKIYFILCSQRQGNSGWCVVHAKLSFTTSA
jgi:hypothetical protein